MEDALALGIIIKHAERRGNVLILVVMEDALAPTASRYLTWELSS